jgi:hypothetical protein
MQEDTDLDAVILSVATYNWLKVAMIIAKTSQILEAAEASPSYQRIAERVVALVERGHLEGAGDLSLWRHSEVRLPVLASE